VHAHNGVLIHVLLYSTRLIDLFLTIFLIYLLNEIPHVSLQRPDIIMRWQVFNSYSEILSLDHSLSNFLICLQLHCSQVLKEEKHQESSGNISYNYDKRHNFFLKIDFVHEKKVYIA